jgi:hypothetical protein
LDPSIPEYTAVLEGPTTPLVPLPPSTTMRPLQALDLCVALIESSRHPRALCLALELLAALLRHPRNLRDMGARGLYAIVAVVVRGRGKILGRDGIAALLGVVTHFGAASSSSWSSSWSSSSVAAAASAAAAAAAPSPAMAAAGDEVSIDHDKDAVLANAAALRHWVLEWEVWRSAPPQVRIAVVRWLGGLVMGREAGAPGGGVRVRVFVFFCFFFLFFLPYDC